MPDSTFNALTYWSFKQPRTQEFALFVLWVDNPETVRYEARQALFDVERKLVLFTFDVPADGGGRIMGRFSDHQRIDLDDGEHPVTLRVCENLGHLIYNSDIRFEMAWKALH